MPKKKLHAVINIIDEEMKRCSKCGIEKSLSAFSNYKNGKEGKNSRCRSCAALYQEEHKKEIVAWNKQYQQDHKAEGAAKQKRYRQRYKDRIAKYLEENREKSAEWQKQYWKTEKGKDIRKRTGYRRRALKAKVGYERFNSKEIFERDGYKCQLCNRKTRLKFNQYHPLHPNLDHIIPLSKGGPHAKINTQCLCRKCNMLKNNAGTGDQLRVFG